MGICPDRADQKMDGPVAEIQAGVLAADTDVVLVGFDADGEVVKPIQIQTVKDGLFRYYGVITDPKLITPSK